MKETERKKKETQRPTTTVSIKWGEIFLSVETHDENRGGFFSLRGSNEIKFRKGQSFTVVERFCKASGATTR